MFVIKYKALFFSLSAILVVASLWALGTYGLKLGTDFTGGTLFEIEYASSTRPAATVVEQALKPLALGNVSVQPTGERGLTLRMQTIDEPTRQKVVSALVSQTGKFTEKRFTSVGPALGTELARKGVVAIVLVVILIVLYIALAFRKVSRPVSSWKYGLIAILALAHDVIIPMGVFALLGEWYGVEVDALFLTALLTILGLSVNDTIVVFDRIRENLRHRGSETFAEVVGRSLRQTFARSFNTSFTVVIVLLALLVFGSETTRWFALALTIGMVVGTYSSIFLASPLLVVWNRRER